jgi:prenylated cyclic peptide (anacyclamide/piricyclamide family)
MKTKKSLNPQIVAPVERTTATSRNAGSQGVDAANAKYYLYRFPFSGDDAE